MSLTIKSLVLNDWDENTYFVYDQELNCIVIDPGCNSTSANKELESFIDSHHLKVNALINTHCHIDHVLGNHFVHSKYQVPLQSHRGEQVVLDMQPQIAQMYGVNYIPSPPISVYLEDQQKIHIGNMSFKILLTPGHSPASICLYFESQNFVIGGDVLFKGSIGRTDLPGGDYDTLIHSIKSKLFTLADDTIIYPGHGPETTIGYEKHYNPFF